MRKSGPGAKHPVHETVTTCVMRDAVIPASSSAVCAARRESSGACRMYSALRRAVPGARSTPWASTKIPSPPASPRSGITVWRRSISAASNVARIRRWVSRSVPGCWAKKSRMRSCVIVVGGVAVPIDRMRAVMLHDKPPSALAAGDCAAEFLRSPVRASAISARQARLGAASSSDSACDVGQVAHRPRTGR